MLGYDSAIWISSSVTVSGSSQARPNLSQGEAWWRALGDASIDRGAVLEPSERVAYDPAEHLFNLYLVADLSAQRRGPTHSARAHSATTSKPGGLMLTGTI